MNLKQIEAFKAVVELGSFTRAGDRIGLTQPAVSKLIGMLERNCGFMLFQRKSNGVIPTSEGKLLYAEVDRVFLGVRSITDRAKSIRRLEYGEIRVVTYPSLATHVLPPILSRFLKDRPGLKLEVLSQTSRSLIERVAIHGVDVGFGMLAVDRPGVRFEHICSMEAVCVLPSDHRLASRKIIYPTDLVGERFIAMLGQSHAELQIDRIFDAAGIERDIVLYAQFTEACCAFVAAGLGVSIVDIASIESFGMDKLVVKPFRPKAAHDVWAIVPDYRPPSLATLALIEHVRLELSSKFSEMQRHIEG